MSLPKATENFSADPTCTDSNYRLECSQVETFSQSPVTCSSIMVSVISENCFQCPITVLTSEQQCSPNWALIAVAKYCSERAIWGKGVLKTKRKQIETVVSIIMAQAVMFDDY